ncbi:fibronectin type III domain-containing protein [Clostridium oryzae]|uniref:Lysozyme M1 n=1 Tax=Clostridium oryzae TaxID=1450648 RepID=A0A1V4IW64_9CLOT|nr:GH25 family lysozyme [Clostridium oryzae]OPJ64035.1 lysozyme M1 precursor [Clostridium oryzae]
MEAQKGKIRKISSIIILIAFLVSIIQIPQTANAAVKKISIPIEIKVASVSYNSVIVSWREVQGVSGYSLYMATSSNGKYKLIKSTAANSYIVSGLSTGKTYYYKIRAYKILGKKKIYGTYSSIGCGKPILAAPISVKVIQTSNTGVTMSWEKVQGASGYILYQATSSEGAYKLIKTTTEHTSTITGLIPGVNYYYKVRAYITKGNSRVYSDYSTAAVCKTTLAAPSSLEVVSLSYSSANVSWSEVPGATGYELYRSISQNGSYSLITTTSSSSYKDTGLAPGKVYYYKVRAYSTIGYSKVYSAFSSVENSQLMLLAPTSLKAQASSYDTIKLSWSKVTGANGYQIYRAASKEGNYSLVATVSTTSYSNTKLTVGKSYYYKIRAYGILDGNTTYSDFSPIRSAKLILSVPKSVKASVYSFDSVNVSWKKVSGASGYEIYRSESNNEEYQLITSINAKTYRDSGLKTGTSYYYKIRAFRTVGSGKVYSGFSSVVNSKPQLYIPKNIKAEASSENSITVSWNALGGAVEYEVYKAEASEGPYNLISTSSSSACMDIGLETGGTYYYKVRACAAVGGSKIYSDFTTVVSCVAAVVNVTAVSLNKSKDTLTVGNTDTLIVSITPQNASNQAVTWSSSDDSVVTVDDDGNITAVGAGTAVITVITVDGEKKASCSVTVSDNSSDTKIKGIDVSRWQENINWSAVKSSGVKFAMIRSSYGSKSADPMFEVNYAGAKANGIAVGAYHYSYATTTAKAAVEVNNFMKQLQGKQFEYPVCIDMEDASMSSISRKTLTDIVLVYLKKLTQAGYYPMIYANKNWFTSKLDDTRLKPYDHWLAQWTSSISYDGPVGIWQYSDAGSVKGISGRVDMDISYVDYTSKIKAAHLNGF